MTALRAIPIKVVGPGATGPLSGNAAALLHEIEALLATLVATGCSSAIDLRGIPLTPADRAYLRERLGDGEVRADINALGTSEVRETAYAGVWWVTHRSVDGAVCAELIEVTRVPAILATAQDELAPSLARLQAALGSDGANR